jgi:predicted alpha/beta hydrolase
MHQTQAKQITVECRAQDAHRFSTCIYDSDDASAPVFLVLPAMGTPATYYEAFCTALQQSGMNVAIADIRGIGSSSIRPSRKCDFGYREIIEQDLNAFVNCIKEHFPESPRILFGHSLGGQLWSLFLSKHPSAASGLATMTSCNVHYQGWPRPARYRVLGMAFILRMLGAALGYVPAAKLGFAGTEAKTVIVDWSNNCMNGQYVLANDPTDYETAMATLCKPILAISIEGDNLAPKLSVDKLVTKMKTAIVARMHLVPEAIGLNRPSHFGWAKRPSAVIVLINTWAKEFQLFQSKAI